MVLQRSSLGKCHLDDVLVRLSRADDAAVGKDGSPWRCRLDPLHLFDDFRVCCVDDCTHLRERLSAPVSKLVDLFVDQCRGRFHWDGLFHVQAPNLAPNVDALSVTCNPRKWKPLLANTPTQAKTGLEWDTLLDQTIY